MKNQLPRIILDNVKMIPQKAEFCMMAVQFEHLWKIRAPVKKVEKFNLSPFDDIIQVGYSEDGWSCVARGIFTYYVFCRKQ